MLPNPMLIIYHTEPFYHDISIIDTINQLKSIKIDMISEDISINYAKSLWRDFKIHAIHILVLSSKLAKKNIFHKYDIICTYINKWRYIMIEIGVSQAQMQFTKLLDKVSIIVDKKSKIKKAVILPYDEYQKLLKNQKKNPFEKKEGAFDDFMGLLSDTFESEDERYKQIVK